MGIQINEQSLRTFDPESQYLCIQNNRVVAEKKDYSLFRSFRRCFWNYDYNFYRIIDAIKAANDPALKISIQKKLSQQIQKHLSNSNISTTKRKEYERKMAVVSTLIPQPPEAPLADMVSMGQGEYIVYEELPDGGKGQVSRETFDRVYNILLEYIPLALIQSGSERASEKCANRFEEIQTRIKEINPNLRAAFVPKTLYELAFIQKSIKEDLKAKSLCPIARNHRLLKPFGDTEEEISRSKQSLDELQRTRKCCHLCLFTDHGDNQASGVKEMAYRLNQTFMKRLMPSSPGFSFQNIRELIEEKINFLKIHYERCQGIGKKLDLGQASADEIELFSWKSTSCPTTDFGFETLLPLGLRNEEDAQIVRKAVALECSPTARHSLFIYRGTGYQRLDNPVDTDECSNKERAFSLSFGSSLFAGCMFDSGATAFSFMSRRDAAYAIPVPFAQVKDSPFSIPATHTVAQLFGAGEHFHARSKAWKDFDVQKIRGINTAYWNREAAEKGRDLLKSHLTKEELLEQFQAYENASFVFKCDGQIVETRNASAAGNTAS